MSESRIDEDLMAQDQRCWDGNWLVDGYNGMFIKLNNEDFMEAQLAEFQRDQESGRILKQADEFLILDHIIGSDRLEENWAKIQLEFLRPRNLHVADGVVRRVAEGNCPHRLRIRRIPKDEWIKVLEFKQEGNTAFGAKNHEKAIGLYKEAFIYIPGDMFVGPKEQMDQIVNLLSNQAECYLRLKMYQDAGKLATDALLLDNGHEKSRMRRVKANIAGTSYLVQAQVDLEEILNKTGTAAGVKEAKDYLNQLKELLENEKKTYRQNTPDGDWELFVDRMRAPCW